MEKQFDYLNQYHRDELGQWLQDYSEEAWQQYIDFTLSDAYKKEFSYDERHCLIVVKKFLKIKILTSKEFKMVNWAYNLIQRVDELKSQDAIRERIESGDSNLFNQHRRHFTFRVAWHDNKWNGTVCNDPIRNIYCSGYHSLLSDRIRREKEKIIQQEVEFAGKHVNDILNEKGVIPPCFWSINAFGDRDISVKHYNPAATHLAPIKENLPQRSIFSWPFAFSFIRTNEEYKMNGKYPANLEKVRVPRFRSKIKKNESIGFIYSKFSNPLSYEDMKYLVVGCGIIRDIGDVYHFGPEGEIEKIRNRKRDLRNFPSVNWSIRFSFDPDTLVRLPYHEYLTEAKRRSMDKDESEAFLEKLKVTIDEPELEHCFKYVAMDIDDDEAIYILTKIRAKLIDSKTHGVVEIDCLDKELHKIENMLDLCWNQRTHFPGFRNLVRVLLDINENDSCRLDDFVISVKESEPDYCLKIKNLLDAPTSDSDYFRSGHLTST